MVGDIVHGGQFMNVKQTFNHKELVWTLGALANNADLPKQLPPPGRQPIS